MAEHIYPNLVSLKPSTPENFIAFYRDLVKYPLLIFIYGDYSILFVRLDNTYDSYHMVIFSQKLIF